MGAPFGEGSTRLAKAYHGRAGEVSAGRLYPDAKTKAGGLGRPRRRAREVWILAHESNFESVCRVPDIAETGPTHDRGTRCVRPGAAEG